MGGRSRKNEKSGFVAAKLIFRLVLLLITLFFLWQAFGTRIFRKWLPSSERKDLNEWFEVNGDEVRIYLDGSMESEQKGRSIGESIYLPYEYVRDVLNSRFFLNDDGTITHTLPDEQLVFDSDSTEAGVPVLLREEGGLYLLLDTVEKYTNLTHSGFTGEDISAGRVFLYTGGSSFNRAAVKARARIRTRTSQSAPILTECEKGSTVIVYETLEEWSRVCTEDGIIGYIANDQLGDTETVVRPDTWTMPETEHSLLENKVVMAWHGVYGPAGNEALDSHLEAAGGAINVISPTWMQIKNGDGEYENYASAEYIDRAHEAGLQVWAAIDNFNQPGGLSEFNTGEFFSNRERRADFVGHLAAEAADLGLDGINLDFEGISADSGPAFVQMVRELSVACHREGLVLSVDNYVPYTYNRHYDLREQALYADYVVIMCYDEHTGKDVGSVSSLPWLNDGITEALTQVPAEQLIGAVPFYTRCWRISGDEIVSESMGMTDADKFAAGQEIPLVWDEQCGQFYGEKTSGKETVKIWMEDVRSLTLKSELLKSCELGGIAAWRLGYEPREVWDVLNWNGGEPVPVTAENETE